MRVAAAALEAAADAILIVTVDGLVIGANLAAESLFGYRARELAGRPITELLPGVDTLGVQAPGEVAGRRRDGHHIDVSVSLAEFRIDEAEHYVATVRDITAEVARRRETEELTSRLVQQSELADARLAIEELARATRGLDELAHALLGALARRVGARAGVLYLRRAEEGRPAFEPLAQLSIAPHCRPVATLVQAACAERDVHVVTGKPASLLVDTGFGYAVPAAVAAVPLVHHDDVVGALELALPVGDPRIRARLGALLPTVAAVLVARIDQQWIHSLLTHASEQADKLQQLNVTLDERAALLAEQQRELRESHAELQLQTDLLDHQRRELLQTNAELEQASALAEQRARELDTASRYKSQFLANVSHELRTPLNSILILARLLVEDGGERLDADQLQSARAIGAAGRDLLELINDILDISRIEVGELRVSAVRFDLRKSIAGLEQLFRPVAEERGLAFDVVVDGDLPARVVTDELRLQQIVRNLLSNAFKFTEEGGVTLRVTSSHAPGQVRFSVQDTGVGIPEEARERIFEAFKQVDGSLTRRHTGAGLGLAISHRLAERMGGALSLASSSARGSTFELDLPVGLPDATPALLPDRVSSPRHPEAVRGDIVIATTDPLLGHALAALARSMGHGARWFPRSADAYFRCLESAPVCVIVDSHLPDTEELVASLAANPDTREIPIHGMAGAENPLAKPLSAERFADWLGTSLVHVRGSVLVVAENPATAAATTRHLTNQGIASATAWTAEQSVQRCIDGGVSCLVVDFDGDMGEGAAFLEARARNECLGMVPAIVTTARPPDDDARTALEGHARTIVVARASGANRQPPPPVGDAPELVGRRVLVVDDDVRNVFALRQLLRKRRVDVVVADDGAEALRRVDEHGPFDAILMDVMMPVMDGLEATRRLRRRPDGTELWILALTAKAMPGDRERCLDAGASDYLSKPVDSAVLLQRLEERFRTAPPVRTTTAEGAS